MASPPRPPPALMEELVEEILLRFPAEEPAGLVRAAAVCKRWYRLVSSPRFRRRFREAHPTPPMLGFLCNVREDGGEYVARFVPAASSCPPRADHRGWRALDARHGRVLLRSMVWGPYLDVWDPITGARRELPTAPPHPHGWNAAVLCAATGACDHQHCRGGPFLVVVVGTDPHQMSLCVYSSRTARWTEPTYLARPPQYGVDVVPTALVGSALYFVIDVSRSILKYDLATRRASVIHQPPGSFGNFTALMTMEDGGLQVARLEEHRLSLWSMEAGPGGDVGWARIRVIELEKLLSVDALSISDDFVGFAHGIGVFFVGTNDGWLFSIDLKSGMVRKVWEDKGIHGIVPYISFYTPALGAAFTDEEPGVGASNA